MPLVEDVHFVISCVGIHAHTYVTGKDKSIISKMPIFHLSGIENRKSVFLGLCFYPFQSHMYIGRRDIWKIAMSKGQHNIGYSHIVSMDLSTMLSLSNRRTCKHCCIEYRTIDND